MLAALWRPLAEAARSLFQGVAFLPTKPERDTSGTRTVDKRTDGRHKGGLHRQRTRSGMGHRHREPQGQRGPGPPQPIFSIRYSRKLPVRHDRFIPANKEARKRDHGLLALRALGAAKVGPRLFLQHRFRARRSFKSASTRLPKHRPAPVRVLPSASAPARNRSCSC
jgi:hypothetical protein